MKYLFSLFFICLLILAVLTKPSQQDDTALGSAATEDSNLGITGDDDDDDDDEDDEDDDDEDDEDDEDEDEEESSEE